MYKYADYISLFVIALWVLIYKLFSIPFASIVTGIVLFVLFVIFSLLLNRENKKEKKEKKSKDADKI
jgi:predicted membrane protein